MKIHLIKDGDVSNETFTEVFDLLNALDGPIQFLCDNDNLIDFSEDDYVENIILNQPVPVGTGLPGLLVKVTGPLTKEAKAKEKK